MSGSDDRTNRQRPLPAPILRIFCWTFGWGSRVITISFRSEASCTRVALDFIPIFVTASDLAVTLFHAQSQILPSLAAGAHDPAVAIALGLALRRSTGVLLDLVDELDLSGNLIPAHVKDSTG